ncbi:hypothetical protein BZA77DRAFT_6359 [Pyronema omphalodes]|nr:hypothetical protein BZA77DRAFT_6359 [Pyronema omphalodes]
MTDRAAFLATYVTPNAPPNAPSFNPSLLTLPSTLPYPLRISLYTAVFCALKRGDLVDSLFNHFVDLENHDATETFLAARSGITTTVLFSGAPQVLPASLALAGQAKFRGLKVPSNDRGYVTGETLDIGRKTHADIYKASNNSAVFSMLGEFVGDVEYALVCMGFGLFMSGDGLKEKELVLAAAITAMGARRQAGSHLKACFGFGWGLEEVKAVVEMVEGMAEYLGVKGAGGYDVDKLQLEALATLAASGAK